MRLHASVEQLQTVVKHSKEATRLLEEVLAEARAAERAQRTPLTNKMRIAGWTGPSSWRLQTYESKKVACTCCGKVIAAGDQHIGWSVKPCVPEHGACYAHADDDYRRFAHPECLRRLAVARISCRLLRLTLPAKLYGETREDYAARAGKLRGELSRSHAATQLGMKWPEGLYFVGIEYVPKAVRDLPAWSTL